MNRLQLRLNARKADSDRELRKRTVTAMRSPPVQTIRVPAMCLHSTHHPQVCPKRQRDLTQRKPADLVPLALSAHVQPGVRRAASIARNAERSDHASASSSVSITEAMTNVGLAWIGQLIGHKIEGKKRAFLHDLVLWLIGPAWLMSKIYAKIGQRYRVCPAAIRGGAVANAVFAPCAPDSSDRASCA